MANKFQEFNYTDAGTDDGTFLTGIRPVTKSVNEAFITGVFKPASGGTQGLLYKGPLGKNVGEWHLLNFPDTASTALYSVDDLGDGQVQAVGSYKTDATGGLDLGCFYQGDLDGNGTWIRLDPSELVADENDQVLNVIAHSVHGGIVVGNFDTKIYSGRAFIYNIATGKFLEIVYSDATSVTAYGIWHNGGTSYTIVGGYSEIGDRDLPAGIAKGLVVDWDSDSEEFANWASYEYDDQPVKSIFYHFSGITPYGKDGYALSAWVVDPSGSGFGARTIVKRNKKGEFKKGKFTRWTYPGSILTTSDSVWQNWIIGVFNTKDDPTIHGYVLRIT